MSALARAARKSKKRFAGALEGFALIAVDLTFGRGQLARLDAARVTRVFPRLLGDLARLEAAGGLMRLARELLPERVPEPAVFELLSDWYVRAQATGVRRQTEVHEDAASLARNAAAAAHQAVVRCPPPSSLRGSFGATCHYPLPMPSP